MVLNLKVASIIGAVTLASIISPAFHSLRRQCFAMNSNVLLTKALSVEEPILKCKEENGQKRDYSVFLVLANDSGSSSARVARLRVVDNTDNQTKWEGPNRSGSGQWGNWAIQIFEDRNNLDKETVSIRVPKDGKTWRQGEAPSISCQVSQLQLKGISGKRQCSGSFVQAKNMKLDLQASNIIISPKSKVSQFEWKDDFKQKPVFCTS